MLTDKGISLIIFCYNSEKIIERTLQSALYQNVIDDFPWEILVIDNNSADATMKRVKEILADHPKGSVVRMYHEHHQGLSFARKRGLDEANYEYVVLCDDDNFLADNYLQKVWEIFEGQPGIGIIGSRAKPLFEEEPPLWIHDHYKAYALGSQYDKSGDCTDKKFVWGAGMALRKSAFLKLKEAEIESLLSDRKGRSLSAGGDSELCAWYIIAGYRIWYDDELILNHFVASKKLTHEYLEKLYAGFHNSYPVIEKYHLFIDYKSESKNPIQRIFSIGKLCLGYCKNVILKKVKKTNVINYYKNQLQLAFGPLLKVDPIIHSLYIIEKKISSI
jgi:glycosyltransferase involved in cell wall biosynthesis